MTKPFRNPKQAAVNALTNRMGDFEMQFGDWDADAKKLELAIALWRQLEEPCVYELETGVVVGVWTSMVREMTDDERLQVLKKRLMAIQSEAAVVQAQIKGLTAITPQPFNLKHYNE